MDEQNHGKEFGRTMLMFALIIAIVVGLHDIKAAIQNGGERCKPVQQERLGEG